MRLHARRQRIVRAGFPDGLNAPFQWDGGIPKPAGYQPPPFLGPSIGNGLPVDYMGPTFGKAPRVYNWSIDLQHEVKKFLIEVDYAGNRGHGLNSTIDLNQVNPSYLYLGSLAAATDHVPGGGRRGLQKALPELPGQRHTGAIVAAVPAVPQRLVAQ